MGLSARCDPLPSPALSVFPSSPMNFQGSGPCAGADWRAFSPVWVDVTQGCGPRPRYTSCLLKGVSERVCERVRVGACARRGRLSQESGPVLRSLPVCLPQQS